VRVGDALWQCDSSYKFIVLLDAGNGGGTETHIIQTRSLVVVSQIGVAEYC